MKFARSQIEPTSTPAAAPVLSTLEPVGIFQQLLDGLAEQAGIIDADTGMILAVNEAWVASTKLNNLSGMRAGFNYFTGLADLAAAGHPRAATVIGVIDEIRRGERDAFRWVFQGFEQEAEQSFEMRIGLMQVGSRRYLRVTRYDITELAMLRQMREEFNHSLLEAQESERRRMGRELHDSGMQLLASLGLSLARLKHLRQEVEVAGITEDMESVLLEVHREFRSISFLAHPPQVERLGLVNAVQQLVEGFGERAGLDARFTVEGTVGELPVGAARGIFRVIQETISNVHRHARARKLAVRLVGRERALHVVVADDGRGIPANPHFGVGLVGMRSRMQELGGRLTIRDASPGTVILASLPLRAAECPADA